MNEAAFELAWAAGLFEGEGCIFAQPHNTGRLALQLQLASTDRDVVERFAKAMGCGRINCYKAQRENWKPMWYWVAGRRVDAERAAALLEPFLCRRRAQKLQEVRDLLVAQGPPQYGRGQPKSPEHRANLSKALKRYRASLR